MSTDPAPVSEADTQPIEEVEDIGSAAVESEPPYSLAAMEEVVDQGSEPEPTAAKETTAPEKTRTKSKKVRTEERTDPENMFELCFVFCFLQMFHQNLKRFDSVDPEYISLPVGFICLHKRIIESLHEGYNQDLYFVTMSLLKTLQERDTKDISAALRRIINRHMPNDYTSSINPFIFYQKDQASDEEGIPRVDYFDLKPGAKVTILYNLVLWVMSEYELIMFQIEKDRNQTPKKRVIKKDPFLVTKKYTLWRFDGKFHVKLTPKESPYFFKEKGREWVCVARNTDEMRAFAEGLTEPEELETKEKMIEMIPEIEKEIKKKKRAEKRIYRLHRNLGNKPMFDDRLRDRRSVSNTTNEVNSASVIKEGRAERLKKRRGSMWEDVPMELHFINGVETAVYIGQASNEDQSNNERDGQEKKDETQTTSAVPNNDQLQQRQNSMYAELPEDHEDAEEEEDYLEDESEDDFEAKAKPKRASTGGAKPRGRPKKRKRDDESSEDESEWDGHEDW